MKLFKCFQVSCVSSPNREENEEEEEETDNEKQFAELAHAHIRTHTDKQFVHKIWLNLQEISLDRIFQPFSSLFLRTEKEIEHVSKVLLAQVNFDRKSRKKFQTGEWERERKKHPPTTKCVYAIKSSMHRNELIERFINLFVCVRVYCVYVCKSQIKLYLT